MGASEGMTVDIHTTLGAKWLALFDPLEMLSYIHVDDCVAALIGQPMR